MSRAIRLRAWQRAALDALDVHPHKDFLAVATPGAGKTTFALTAVVRDLAQFPHRRVIVVAPTSHLKMQWADAAASGFGLQLEPEWNPKDGWPTDMHGIVTTYQQVSMNPRPFRGPAHDAMIVLDEVHHAGTDRAWGDTLIEAFEPAARRLCLSGTPFRSDQNAIPFVEYAFDEAVSHFTYGYGDALEDGGVVRPVFFPRIGGHMEWTAPDGTERSASFDDVIDRPAEAQRLRTALSPTGEWLPSVLRQAHERLLEIRETHPSAGGLVIAMDVEHAQAIQVLLKRMGATSVVATSDDPQASEKIAAFSASRDPWIVAVRMVSEGVDIPRLRVGVWATNTVTELFFRQAVGRVIRWTRGMRRQKAFFFLPDDPRLRFLSANIALERRHSLKVREAEGLQDPTAFDNTPVEDDGQLSMFAALSAVATDVHDPGNIFDDHHPEDVIHEDPLDDDPSLMLELPPPPPRRGAGKAEDGAAPDLAPVSTSRRKKELRQANSDRVGMLAILTGMDHAEINGKLNAEAGIQKIAEATVKQLEKRLQAADRWVSHA